jgi:hypothetical protein
LSDGVSDADRRSASPGHAGPSLAGEEEARRAFDAGLEASRDERWSDAEASFRRSTSLVRRRSSLYNLALSVYMQGRLTDSVSILEETLGDRDVPPDPTYDEYARTLLSRVRSETSRLHLTIAPPAAAVRLDGKAAPGSGTDRSLSIAPGTHRAEVSAPGYVTRSLSIDARAGTELNRTVALDPIATDAPILKKPHPEDDAHASFATSVAPWIVIGVGGALLAAGAVTGLVAFEGDKDLRGRCPSGTNCDPALKSDRDRVVRLGHVADALLVSGGVFVTGGVVWKLLVPRGSADVTGHAVVVELGGHF